MFAGMQEPQQYLSRGMIRQGLLRRILLCYVKSSELNRWKPPLDVFRSQIYEKLDEFIEDLTQKMIKYQKSAPISVIHLPNVMNRINEYARELDAAVEKEESDYNIYRQSYWEHVTKISALEAIAEGSIREDPNRNLIADVKKEHLERALDFVAEVTSHMEEVIQSLGAEKKPVVTAEDPLERVYNIIAEGGDKGIARYMVYRKAKMLADELDEIIATLIQAQRVEVIRKNTSGRIATFYRVRE